MADKYKLNPFTGQFDDVGPSTIVLSSLTPGTAAGQVILAGVSPFTPAWSGFLLSGTTGGKLTIAVTNTKTLTLTSTGDFNLTVPATGTAALGTGASGYTARWTGTNALSYGVVRDDGSTVGMGAAPAANRMLECQMSSAVNTSPIMALDVYANRSSGTGTSNEVLGVDLVSRNSANGNHSGQLTGGRFSCQQFGSGSVTTGVGGYFGVTPYAGTIGTAVAGRFALVRGGGWGAVTAGYGVLIDTPDFTPTTYYGLFISAAAGTTNYSLYSNGGQSYFMGNVGMGITVPTARLHLGAGSTTANTAPVQFTSGNLETAARAGVMEFLTDDLYFTITTGAARKMVVLNDGTALTATRVPFATTNGRLTDDSDMTFSGDTLTVTKVSMGLGFITSIKSGATQAGAGAAANEIWKTASHATLPDNVLMIGV